MTRSSCAWGRQRASHKLGTASELAAVGRVLSQGGDSKMTLTGLGMGGQQIQNARKSYLTAIELLVELASLQTAFLTLDEAIKTTNRRVNALDNVVRPKLENTISYIKVSPLWLLSSSLVPPPLSCHRSAVWQHTTSLWQASRFCHHSFSVGDPWNSCGNLRWLQNWPPVMR
jgi:ATP synthase subunit D